MNGPLRHNPRASRRVAAVAALSALATLGVSGTAGAYDMIKHKGPIPNVAPIANGINENDITVVENLGDRVPRDLTFTDGHGATVSLGSILDRGKPVLVTLGYYHCPQLCNLVHEGLAKGIKTSGLELGKDFFGLAVSIDPDEDPKSASSNEGRLLRALGVGTASDWPFVFDKSAPDAPVARSLAKAVGFRYKYDEKTKQFAHSAVAFVLAPDGKISRYVYGVDFAPRDLRFAIVEASDGRVGTTLDRVLLTCFKYDPMVQKYTPMLSGIVRLTALACFLALAGLLAVLWRRETVMRRRRPA